MQVVRPEFCLTTQHWGNKYNRLRTQKFTPSYKNRPRYSSGAQPNTSCSRTYACKGYFRPNARFWHANRAFEQGSGGFSKDPSLDEYVEVKVDSVRVAQGTSVVYLRVLDSNNLVIPVHIGESESSALLKEINKQRQMRPLTHDVSKNMLQAVGFRVTKIRITDIIANTYYARIHLGRASSQGSTEVEEVDVDARPSDAINLAVRFGAPMYVNKKIAEVAAPQQLENFSAASESHADIVRSVKEALSSYEDPTVMYQLQKALAIKEERFEDAKVFQQSIYHEMTHNQLLRLVVAMEAALGDGRYDEAARLRDEYKRLMQSIDKKS